LTDEKDSKPTDAERKGSILLFLYDTGLIKSQSLLSLSGANLRDANLSKADLSKADLSEANLSGAKLHGAKLMGAKLVRADLRDADLSKADLSGADLSGAKLMGAKLHGADLSDANLSDADLSGADLSDANLLATDLRTTQNFNPTQLKGEDPLLCNVALPEGFKDKDKLKDRDCDRLPQELLKRYTQRFQSLEDAKKYVDVERQKKWE
jgi:uncharacterized protein YjbI with pentapeptide repeats